MEEVHYIGDGFPFALTESFMDLFEGLTYAQADAAAFAGALQEQGNSYWSTMHTNTDKYGYCCPISNSYYSLIPAFEVNSHTPQLDVGWDSQPPITDQDDHQDANSVAPVHNEDCIRVHHDANSQVLLQDSIDPDSMTYEELLDLGESVGTQNRGLSKELISTLPIVKYKHKYKYSFFSRKKLSAERCVVCQMNYKRGETQMILPCKHKYHDNCVSRWLGINKACPVCFVDVYGNKDKVDKARR